METKVLAYLIYNSNSKGVFVSYQGYRLSIAKAMGLNIHAVQKSLLRLKKRNLIDFTADERKKIIFFHPAFKLLTAQQNQLLISFTQ